MRKLRNITPVEQSRQELAEPYVPKLLEALSDAKGNLLNPAQIFAVLAEAGILKKIEKYKGLFGEQDPDALSPAEQFDQQKRDLYHRAMNGDTQAKKLWFELHSLLDQDLDFNIKINVVPYRVKDESMQMIAMQADKNIARQILQGFQQRLEVDEAPHELRNDLYRFMRDFEAWAKEAYKPKNMVE